MSLVVGVLVLIQLLLASVVTDAAGIKCGLCLPHFPLYGSNYLVNYTGEDSRLLKVEIAIKISVVVYTCAM